VDNVYAQRYIGNPTRRLFGDLGAVAASRSPSEKAPNNEPAVFLLDAYDSRLLIRYYEPAARDFGFHAYAQGLLHPHGLAFRTGGPIYISDTGTDRIVKLSYSPATASASFLSAFGSKGTGETQFNRPRALALDRSGNLYVADSDNGVIKKFDPSGNPIRSFKVVSPYRRPGMTNILGQFGTNPGQFAVPLAVTVSYIDGSIFVSDEATNRIQKFDPDGNLVKQIPGIPNAGSVLIYSLDSDLVGRIYAADLSGDRLFVLDDDLNYLDESRGPVDSPFRELHGVGVDKSVDSSGNLYSCARINVTERARWSVLRFPDVLSAEGADGQVGLHWYYADMPLKYVSGYYVYRATAPDGPYALLAQLVGSHATTYVDTALVNMKPYYYRVSIASRAPAESSPIGPVFAAAYPGPTAPFDLTAIPREGGVALVWAPSVPTVYPVAGYDVYRSGGPSTSTSLHIGRIEGSSATLFLDDTAESGTTYSYLVRGRDSTGRQGRESNPASAAALPDRQWRNLQMSSVHAGVSPTQAVPMPPPLKWGTAAGNGVAVVAKDGIVYQATTDSLAAADVHTGKQVWLLGNAPKTGNGIINTAAVQGDSVYFLSNGAVYALDVANRSYGLPTEQWRFAPGLTNDQYTSRMSSLLPSLPYRTGVTEANETVYFSLRGMAFALDSKTGRLKWSATLSGVTATEFVSPPGVSADAVYYLSNTGRLFAFSAADFDPATHQGSLRYSRPVATGGSCISALVCSEGMLLVSATSRLMALDASTGKPLWTAQGPGLTFVSEAAVSADSVYVVTGNDGALRRYDRLTGLPTGTLALVDGTIIASASCTSAPVIGGGTAFYEANLTRRGSNRVEGRLVAVQLDPSRLGPRFISSVDIGPSTVSLAVAENSVIVGGVAYGRLEATAFALAAPSVIVRNQAFPLRLTAITAKGAVDALYTGTVTLTSTDPDASLPATIQFVAGDRGVKTVEVALRKTGVTKITARGVERPDLAGTISVQAQPSTGQASRLAVTAPPAAAPGFRFSLTVTAQDAFGNTVTSFNGTVVFSSTDPLAQLPAAYPYAKPDSGMHVFSATLFTAGLQTITAKDTSTSAGPAGQATVEVARGHEFVIVPGHRDYSDIDLFGTTGCVVGSQGDLHQPLVLVFNGSAWSQASFPIFDDCATLYQGASAAMDGTGAGWVNGQASVGRQAVCPTGRFEFRGRFAAGGWPAVLRTPLPAIPSPRSMTMVTPTDGWLETYQYSDVSMTTGESQLLRYNGSNWSLYHSFGAQGGLWQIRFVRGAPDEGWAIFGEPGARLSRFVNGSWTPDPAVEIPVLSLWMNAPNDVWAGGYAGVLLRFDGTAWTQWSQTDPPPQLQATFAGLTFHDPNHGIALGSWTGTPPAGIDPNLPVVLYFSNGRWVNIPVSLPAGWHDYVLLDARMPSTGEAWAIGSGFDYLGGVLNQPLLMHLRFPDSVTGAAPLAMAVPEPLAGAAPASGTQRLSTTSPVGSLRIVQLSTTVVHQGGPMIRVGGEVTEACSATLIIYSFVIRPVYTAVRLLPAGFTEMAWNGLGNDGQPVPEGWYLCSLEVSNANGRDHRIGRFILVRLPAPPQVQVSVTPPPLGTSVLPSPHPNPAVPGNRLDWRGIRQK